MNRAHRTWEDKMPACSISGLEKAKRVVSLIVDRTSVWVREVDAHQEEWTLLHRHDG